MRWRAAPGGEPSGHSVGLARSSAESISGLTRPKLAPNCSPKPQFAQQNATLKRISQLSARTSPSCRLLFTCVILIATTAALSRAQQRELPTVIVRGFLNYRTTVDGTVLLFTPDAGQQQQPPPSASAAIQTRTSQAASPATSAIRGGANSVLVDTLAMAIEPTSVQLPQMATEPPRPDHSENQESAAISFRPGPHTIANSGAANSAAQPNEWRPIQATPPLKLNQMSSSSLQAPNHAPNQESPSASSSPARPSVQADDVSRDESHSRSRGAVEQPRQNEAAETRASSGRLRRPSLGFTGQGFRPRVPGTEGAVSPALQPRAKPESGASNVAASNSINGIRRPGLTSSPSPASQAGSQSASPNELAAPANVSSAFQSRLTNASARLKNRFKHRQPVPAGASLASSPVAAARETSSSDPKQRNNLVAPGSLLDVAASIEQPTEAARSIALAPQLDHQADQLAASPNPAVGSEELLTIVANSSAGGSETLPLLSPSGQDEPDQAKAAVTVPVVASNVEAETLGGNPMDLPLTAEQQAGAASLSRSGEQPPRVISGQLMQGSLSSGPLSMDNLFLSDQPTAASSVADGQAPSELVPSHAVRPLSGRPMKQGAASQSGGNLNGKLNGWLGQHHNKFVPRPSAKPDNHPNLSHQLANNLQQLNPTAQPTAPIISNQSLALVGPVQSSAGASNTSAQAEPSSLSVSSLAGNGSDWQLGGNSTGSEQPSSMQTITRTYSTIMETTRTRIVPMQVEQATAIYTITEDFLMTKLMTAYQTIPAQAVFILADQELSTRAPFEVFESPSTDGKDKSESQPAPAVAAPAIAAAGPPAEPIETQEQPISLDNSPKSANNWLHDFSNLDGGNSNNPLTSSFNSNSLTQQDPQQQVMLALLEQQARDANLAPGFPLMAPNGEPLDQLASQLDPTALLADGAINIPDLNNPLVLAAAIQNPQLAAVILAAQQLKLKRQQQLQQKPLLQQQQQQPGQPLILQPSYSTSFSTTIRPSTYTARDTMYTTRLVSFRDGRTVRTRTVSEPGSVVEQVLTTMVTETIPFTIAIKPTGVLGAASSPATSLPNIGTSTGSLGAQSNQATINNALFATQLANILSRRQQQLQTSFNGPALGNLAQGSSAAASATPQQLLALQQFLSQQQKRQQPAQPAQQQFQPNFQQLLQSLDNPTTSASNITSIGQTPRKPAGNPSNLTNQTNSNNNQATPALQQTPKSVVSSATPVNQMAGPFTTTLTSIQTRTYTVHNAFKTIFRTITSTILITTVLNAGPTLMPTLG